MTDEIVRGTSADLEAIMPIMQSAFSPDYGEAWSLTQCAGALALTGTALFIYCETGDVRSPSGFAFVRSIFDESELLLIAVQSNCQSRGIGSRLLAHIVESAQSTGNSRLHVEVRHDNPALSFYTRNGFKQAGERKNYYRRKDGHVGTALTLVKPLSPMGSN